MRITFCLLGLGLQVSATTIYPPSCNKNITLVDQFVQAPFNLAANFQCKYHFSVPSGSFANIQLQASDTQYTDTIYISGDDQVHGISMNCAPERICVNYNVSTVYPGNFHILIGTGNTTQLKNVQFNVVLQKVVNDVVGTYTTKTNAQPNLVYFEDWEEGTSYVFTSASTKVSINPALDRYDSNQRDIELNKIFVFVEGGTPVTMNDIFPTATRVTLYLAKKMNIKGAVFVTDLSNLDGIYDHKVQYVPLNGSSRTDYAPLFSNGFYNPPWWGGATIVGEKDGSTPIDIRQFNTFGGSGNFYYASGGPIANHTNAIPFGNRQLPMHLTGNVNTLYIDQQQGNVKYTISV